MFSSKDNKQRTSESGLTLIEVMIAMFIMLVGVGALMGVFSAAVVQTENQGDLATRTTEYCQDKMEQLMALNYNDGATDTTVYPPASTGGTGLGGTMGASQTVGSSNPSSPVSNYVDYLDQNGTLLSSSTGAMYTRVWSIATDSTANSKTITVVANSKSPRGPLEAPPSTTLVCITSNR